MHPRIFISNASPDMPIANELDTAFEGDLNRLPWNIDRALWLKIAEKSDAIILVFCSSSSAEIVSLLNSVDGRNKLVCILRVGSVALPDGLDHQELLDRFEYVLKFDADGPPVSPALLQRLVGEVQSPTRVEPPSVSSCERSEAPASFIGSSQSDSTVCPQCRGTYAVGTRFCGRCGITIEAATGKAMASNCSQCGEQHHPGERFCRRCGRPRGAKERVTAELASTGAPQQFETARRRPITMESVAPAYSIPTVIAPPPPLPRSPMPSAPAPTSAQRWRPSLFERAKEGARSLLDGLRSLATPAISNAPLTVQPPTPTEKAAARDEVRCSVFSPSYAKQGQAFLIQVFAHLVEQANEAAKLASEFDQATHRQGFRTLEEKIERGARLTFQMTVPGLEIEEAVQSLFWRASVAPEAVQFRVRVPSDHPTEPVIGKVTVGRNSVPIGHISFKLLIVSRDLAASDTPTREERPWTPYRKAFISYASEDRKEVLKRVQMLELQGITFFQDFLSLEPGQRWKRELYHEIDRSDVFYLFWSTAAKESEWVMKEVNYALQRKGHDDSAPPAIVPVIIEGPPPVPPPPELAHLHFNHYLIYFMG